jgi:nucleoside 2-deoxyribosyltransferase
MKSVYLAGPISGLTYDGCVSWREYAQKVLLEYGIDGRSPMRAKEFIKEHFGNSRLPEAGGSSFQGNALSTNKGITTRDRYDCTTSDVVLFNFLGAEKPSVGSCVEVGWADGARRPIVVAMEDPQYAHNLLNPDERILVKANPHHHGIVLECAGFVVPTLEEALDIVISILR